MSRGAVQVRGADQGIVLLAAGWRPSAAVLLPGAGGEPVIVTAVPDYEFTDPREATAEGRFIAERNTQFKVASDSKFRVVPLTAISSATGAELRDGNVVITQPGFWQVSAYARVAASPGSW
jgi:hypothetical protein